MKRKFFILICLIASSFCGYTQNEIPVLPDRVIKVKGDCQFPPFEFINEKGELVGFNIDLFKAIAAELELKYEIKLDDWALVQEQLKNKEIDVIMGMMYSQHRAEYAKFGIPHSIIYLSYTCLKSNDFDSFEELRGKEIIVQNHDRSYDYLVESGFTDKIIPANSIAEGLQILESGKGDAVLFGDIVTYYNIEQLGIKDMVVHRTDIAPQRYSIVTNEDNTDLLYLLNMGLYQLKVNGTYDRIYNKWFSIYDTERSLLPARYKYIIFIMLAIIILAAVFAFILRIRVKKATLSLRKSNIETLSILEELRMENTARTETEKLLSENERKFRMVFNSTSESIFLYDAVTLELVDFNVTVFSMYEFPKDKWADDELVKSFFNSDDKLSERRVKYLKNAEMQGPITSQELLTKKYTGQDLWIEIDLTTCKINGDDSIIVVARNIDKRKQSERELIKAKEKAEESDHLKSSFLANLSHEIRTPLNSIMGFASLLPEEEEMTQISQYSKIIVDNSEQLVSMIDEIVLYSKLETHLIQLKRDRFKLADLFESIRLSFVLPTYQGKVELVVDPVLDPELYIYTDYDRIRQVFINLISNAFKYTQSGQIVFGYTIENGNRIIFYVKDTGMGIPQKDIAQIFNRFVRGSNIEKSNIRGTGLGLSIVKELVTLLGGEIWVESELNVGSTFFFTANIQ